MINHCIVPKKSIYLKIINENPSLKNFRFRKINLASLNKTIFIPKLNSVSSISTRYNSNLSIGNILPKKFEIKINKFNGKENLNTLSKIHINRKKIELNLINNKSHNNIFQNIKNLSPITINNKRICFNSSSYREFNSLSQSKSEMNGNISLLTPLNVEDVIYKSKNKNNPINVNPEEQKIKIENKYIENIKLKSIFKKDNNSTTGIPNKKKPRNKFIIKSNILKKEYKRKNNKFNLKQKNIYFLQSILSQNNKVKIEEIDKKRRNKTKYISFLPRQTRDKNIKIEKYNDYGKTKILNILTSLKREIFIKNKIFIEISMYNSINNINISSEKLLVEANINGNINQYLFLKYDIRKYLPSYLGISNIKENLNIPSYIIKYLIRKDIILPNFENDINLFKRQEKEEVKTNNIKKFSIIYKNELKRNTQLNTKKFLSRFSLLGNSEFFTNKKNINKTKENNNNRRKSFYIRNMYTNINRRKSLPMKQILKKEDFIRLKSLIECKKENQFVYELHKLINIYDINSSDKNGNTLLSYACMNNEIYIVNYLLNNGANPNCINKYKNTPLHYALSNKNYAIADLLIQNKAKDNLKNIFGLTPW